MNKKFPSSQLLIRPASFNDVSFIQDVAIKTWPISYSSILPKPQLDYMLEKFYSTASLNKQMKNNHYFFLALLNYSPVGFASFSCKDGSTYKLQKLYVLPEFQKSGVGKKLLETVETVAKSMGAEKLQLNVNRENKARGFYEKNKFRRITEEDIDIGHGFFMNDFIMEKEL